MIQYSVGIKLKGLIYLHTHACFWGGTKDFEDSIVSKLKEKFLTCSKKFENFKYLDLNLAQ